VTEIHFTNLLIVTVAAFAAPFALGLVPSLRLPAVVLEIVLGIVIGPSGLGWVTIDEPIQVLSLIGLAFLLFLAGLEIDFDRLRGKVLKLTLAAFGVSFAIAILVGLGLKAGGFAKSPLFFAIVLCATSLGVIIPILKDAREIGSTFGQLVVAAGTIADFGAIILLTLFFSREATGTGTKVILLSSFAVLAVVAGVVVMGAERSMRISDTLRRLQDTTAQIRVRGAFVLMVAFATLADRLGLEVILGTFAAGAILTLIDRDEMMTHPEFRAKLDAIGYGVFIPAFFVTTGLRFDLNALFSSGSTIARVPIFLAAILIVRGVPALLYRPAIGTSRTVIAALMQSTTLPFIVAATTVGLSLGIITEASAAALIAAGLLSVLIFPLAALTLLRRLEAREKGTEPDASSTPTSGGVRGPAGMPVG
jgi:Kef-type K+ transport system membrane component KefB